MADLRSSGDLLAASPHLTVLKNERLSANAEKAEGADDLLGLAQYTGKIRTLCRDNPYFTQVLSDTYEHLADKIANGPLEIIWGPPPYSKILEFNSYSPWKPARAATERMLREALVVAKDKVVQSYGFSENGNEIALNAAIHGVEEIVGGTLQQTFDIAASSAAGARDRVRQITLAKTTLSSSIQASMTFTKAVLFDTVDAAKVDFVASGEYEIVKVRTYAMGRETVGTAKDAEALDRFVSQEIGKYMRLNPEDVETFGYCFKCDKDSGKWVATEVAVKNKQSVCDALADVPPMLELQEKAAKAAIEAILKRHDAKNAAAKVVDEQISKDAKRVAEAVTSLNFSGAKVEIVRGLKDSLTTMRGLLRSLKPLVPAEAQHVSLFFEERLRRYEGFGLVVNVPEDMKPKTPDIPARPQAPPHTAPTLEASFQL